MKKILSVFMTVILAIGVLTGCGSTAASSSSGTSSSSSDKKEIYVFIRARGDLSYWDSMAAGGDKAAKDFADKANVHVVETTADVQANLTSMYEAADKGADMIITGGDFIDNMIEVSKENPEIAFVLVNEKLEGHDNIYSIDFSTSQASFLAGIAAADVAKNNGSNTVGFIGGMDEQTIIQEFFLGYIQGVKYYDDNMDVVYSYVGDWGDPDKGKTQALAQYGEKGAGVIFACAGGSGNGVHQAAADTGKFVVGVDSDQSLSYSEQPKIQKTFVTSVLKNLGNGIYDCIEKQLNGEKLAFGKYEIYGLKDNAVGMVENDLFNSLVSEDGKNMIKKATEEISSGKVEVIGALNKDQAEIQNEIKTQLAK